MCLACAEPWGSQGGAQAKLGDPFGHVGTEVVPAVGGSHVPVDTALALRGDEGLGSGLALLAAFPSAGPHAAPLSACSQPKASCLVNTVDPLTSHATRIPSRSSPQPSWPRDATRPFGPRLGPF